MIFENRFSKYTNEKYKDKLLLQEVIFDAQKKEVEIIFKTLVDTSFNVEKNRREIENACVKILPPTLKCNVIFIKNSIDRDVLLFDIRTYFETKFPSISKALLADSISVDELQIKLRLTHELEGYMEYKQMHNALAKYLHKSYNNIFDISIEYICNGKTEVFTVDVYQPMIDETFVMPSAVNNKEALLQNDVKQVLVTKKEKPISEDNFLPQSFDYLQEAKEDNLMVKDLFVPELFATMKTKSVSSTKNNEPSCPDADSKKTYVVYDIETTSLDWTKGTIIEIGAVKIVDGKAVETFAQLIDPQHPLSEETIKITGITDKMLEGQPTLEKVLPKFSEFCGSATLVGHNIKYFDFPWLDYHAKKQGIVFKNPLLDTLQLAKSKLKLYSYKLGTVAAFLGVDLVNAHRALDDATETAEIFLKLSL